MRKVYRKLTQEQKSRNVIFTSQLVPGSTVHEVLSTDWDKEKQIDRLLNDKFFNKSHFKYNLIHQ